MSAKEVAERLRKRRASEPFASAEGTLYLRGLTGRERSEYVSTWGEKVGAEILEADQALVALALVDEHGAPIYESYEQAVESVMDWCIADVSAAAKIVIRLSGMGVEAKEDAEKK